MEGPTVSLSGSRCFCYQYSKKNFKEENSLNNLAHQNFKSKLYRTVLAVIALILVPCAVAQQSNGEPSWATILTNQSNLLGSNVSLDCRVNNLSNRIITWIKLNGEKTDVLFINAGYFKAPSRYFVTFDADSGSTLHLTSLAREDDALYQCDVQNSALTATAKVTVLVKPSTPTISRNLTDEELIAGRIVQFNCSSVGGNPPPSMVWYRNQVQLPNAQVIPPSMTFGTTSSILVWQLNRTDYGANFSCSAENKNITESLVSSMTTLFVKYAPVIFLGIYDPYIVVENSSMTLNCNVTAYPSVDPGSILWYKDGTNIGSGSNLTFNSVSRNKAGIYTCSAENFDVSMANITVDVQYSPRPLPYFSEVRVKEGSTANLTMKFDANPPVNPSSFKWYSNNDATGQSSGSSVLLLPNVQRASAGNFVCEATNTFTPSEGKPSTGIGRGIVQLTVLYKPGKAVVQVPRNVIVGDNVTLTCSVDSQGVPAADLVWTRVERNNTYSNGSTLQLTGVQLSDIGNYSCTPMNEVGFGGTDTKPLDISEPAGWIQPLSQSKIDVGINDSVTGVVCQARGRPAPTLSWYKDGQLIDMTSGWYSVRSVSQMLDSYSWNVTLTLSWSGNLRFPNTNSLRVDDVGNYSCQAFVPSAGNRISQTMNLIIRYPPLMASNGDHIGADPGKTAVILCWARAFPAPIFIWKYGNSQLETKGNYMIKNHTDDGMFRYGTELNIASFSDRDVGNYSCQAANDIGHASLTFTLRLNSVPSTPSQLTKLSKTWESMELSWLPGYDGGCPQDFIIDFQATNISQGSSQVSAGNLTRYNLTELFPNSTYVISIRPRNRVGFGQSSNSIIETTEGFVIDPPFDVKYNTKSKTLTGRYSGTYDIWPCVRLLKYSSPICDNSSQYVFSSSGSFEMKLDKFDVQDGEVAEVSLCLRKQMNICSRSQTAQFVGDDVPVHVIIIVCCVCGSFIIALVIVLVAVCFWLRKKRKSNTEEQHAISAYETQNKPPNQARKTVEADNYYYANGIDNPAVHQIGSDSSTISKYPGTFLNLDPDYPLDRSDSHGSYGSDSGVSVSEVQKPRRIIHEVIV